MSASAPTAATLSRACAPDADGGSTASGTGSNTTTGRPDGARGSRTCPSP